MLGCNQDPIPTEIPRILHPYSSLVHNSNRLHGSRWGPSIHLYHTPVRVHMGQKGIEEAKSDPKRHFLRLKPSLLFHFPLLQLLVIY